jgi:hypothetical protein
VDPKQYKNITLGGRLVNRSWSTPVTPEMSP